MKDDMQVKTKEHFERIAGDYDGYKRKNWYYYENIKKILAGVIAEPHRKRILDIGCGTGEILGFLDPLWGVGIDISENMIEIARNKFKDRKNLYFQGRSVNIILSIFVCSQSHLQHLCLSWSALSILFAPFFQSQPISKSLMFAESLLRGYKYNLLL